MNTESLTARYPGYEGQLVHTETISATDSQTRPAQNHLPDEIATQLGHDLYTHQADALDLLTDGTDICVSTSTSSGKTLIYALEIARQKLDNPDATALFVYPTKALSGDQLRELQALYARLEVDINVGKYDGDTSSEEKKRIRQESDVILTNFAGLNQYLSHHHLWSNVLANIELIAIDEAHMYTGIIGMHVAWIIRRLLRIVESDRYRSVPQLVLTSATIGNPAEHSRRLTGREVTVVDDDGSPRGRCDIVFWNPPRYTGDEGYLVRRSTHLESSQVLAHLTANGQQSLMFAPSRKMTELDAQWTEERLAQEYNTNRARIEPYHAGHTKAERSDLEDRLKEQAVEGVVSTTALEVGINVGSMDATVLSGYPGSRMSFWQQLGRAGRETADALGVLVAQNSSLDQYIMRHPEYLLEDDIEDAVLDLENNRVYMQHILAAAEELPLTASDTAYFDDRLPKVVQMYRNQGELTGDLQTQVQYAGRGRPQDRINIYGTSGEEFEVRLRDQDGSVRTIDRIDKNRAYRDFHPGAVYLHKGQQHEVAEFNEAKHQPEIILEPTRVDYYTQTNREIEIRAIEKELAMTLDSFRVVWGRGTVNEYYPSYLEHQTFGEGASGPFPTGLDDPVELSTKLVWIEIPDTFSDTIRDRYPLVSEDENEDAAQDPFLGGVHAAEHALIHMAPTELMIDPRDLGGLSVSRHPETGTPTLFIYDSAEGGLGFSRAIYESIETLSHRTRELIEDCSCGIRGCPGCVMDYMCGDDNHPMHTDAAIDLLEELTREASDYPGENPSS